MSASVIATAILTRDAEMSELLAADREYDRAKAGRIVADNRIVRGDRSDAAFVNQARAHHAYDRAVDRRRLALSALERHGVSEAAQRPRFPGWLVVGLVVAGILLATTVLPVLAYTAAGWGIGGPL